MHGPFYILTSKILIKKIFLNGLQKAYAVTFVLIAIQFLAYCLLILAYPGIVTTSTPKFDIFFIFFFALKLKKKHFGQVIGDGAGMRLIDWKKIVLVGNWRNE